MTHIEYEIETDGEYFWVHKCKFKEPDEYINYLLSDTGSKAFHTRMEAVYYILMNKILDLQVQYKVEITGVSWEVIDKE